MLQPKFLLSRAKPRSIQITSKTTQKYQLQIEKKSLLFVFYTYVFFHTDCSHLYAFSIHILFYHFLFYYFFPFTVTHIYKQKGIQFNGEYISGTYLYQCQVFVVVLDVFTFFLLLSYLLFIEKKTFIQLITASDFCHVNCSKRKKKTATNLI